MLGKVTVWQMTEEERLAYIEKYPIKPTKHNQIDKNFANMDIDYKWRPAKATAASRKK